VENIGKRTAHLLRSSVGTEFPTRVLLPNLPYRGFNVTGSRELEPGVSTSYEVTREVGAPGVDALMVCGRLEYSGGTTGFCRVWDPTHNHFVAVGGPDYEYED
jgi:hypothetical protein